MQPCHSKEEQSQEALIEELRILLDDAATINVLRSKKIAELTQKLREKEKQDDDDDDSEKKQAVKAKEKREKFLLGIRVDLSSGEFHKMLDAMHDAWSQNITVGEAIKHKIGQTCFQIKLNSDQSGPLRTLASRLLSLWVDEFNESKKAWRKRFGEGGPTTSGPKRAKLDSGR